MCVPLYHRTTYQVGRTKSDPSGRGKSDCVGLCTTAPPFQVGRTNSEATGRVQGYGLICSACTTPSCTRPALILTRPDGARARPDAPVQRIRFCMFWPARSACALFRMKLKKRIGDRPDRPTNTAPQKAKCATEAKYLESPLRDRLLVFDFSVCRF